MCTVVVRVDPGSAWPVTVLALRDESPERPWDPPAAWWPDRDPEVRGVRDRSAGGAWLAASDRAGLAVVLNRAEPVASADGQLPTTRAFNLVRATADGVTVSTWDGESVRTTDLGPGVHMVTHGAADDPAAPRIGRWLEAFRAVDAPSGPPVLGPFDELRTVDSGGDAGDGWGGWFGVLAESAALPSDHPDAILRDVHEAEGHMTTLSIVAAAIAPGRTVLQHARLTEPGRLDGSVELHRA